MLEDIRAVLRNHGQLPVDIDTLDIHDDLYSAGMTSHASVNVMLALEDKFDIEYPDDLLSRASFATMSMILTQVRLLKGRP